MTTRRLWTADERAAMRARYPDTPTAVLAAELGRTVGQVYQCAERLGLKKSPEFLASPAACRLRRGDGVGKPHQFKPGHQTWNKGLKGCSTGRHPNTAAHHYRPGNISGRAAQLVQPLGTLRVNGDGVLERKVATTPGGPHLRWHPVHRLVWESVHGPVPTGHIVVFRPGRKTTELDAITLDAVELVTRQELMRRNTVHRYGKEVAQLVQLRGALVAQINRKAKKAQPT